MRCGACAYHGCSEKMLAGFKKDAGSRASSSFCFAAHASASACMDAMYKQGLGGFGGAGLRHGFYVEMYFEHPSAISCTESFGPQSRAFQDA